MSRARKVALAAQGSERARKSAVAILGVMAGIRTPAEASAMLGVSVNRYYQLETRGVVALMKSLEPMARGRTARPEWEMERMRKEKARWEREAGRYQALLRASQKALGLAVVSPPRGDWKGRRARRPRVRARTVIAELEGAPAAPKETAATT